MSHEMKLEKVEIPAGSVIHQETPFVYILSSKWRTDRCDFCFSKGKLSKCSNCRYVYYCGKACQRQGWLVHKLECQNLKNIAPRIIPDAARLLSRLIRNLRNGGDQIKGYYGEKNYRMYRDLMSHYPNLKKDQRRMAHLSSLYGVLYEFLDNEMIPNSAELMGMFGRMCINSFNIINQELQSLGTGIYLGASIVDHSCQPNALAIFEGTTLYIRNLESLPCMDWSKIFISYIDVLAQTEERQAELELTYYFNCQCSKCLKPETTAEMTGGACPNSNCVNFIDVSNSKDGDNCSKCAATITQDYLSEFMDVLAFTNRQLTTMKDVSYLDVCKVCLRKHKGVLHKFNLKHVKILDMAFESSVEFGNFNEALSFGLELIDCYYKYYGQMHPLTGLLHLKLGKILVYHDRLTDATVHLAKSNTILRITHGITSSLYKEELRPLMLQCGL